MNIVGLRSWMSQDEMSHVVVKHSCQHQICLLCQNQNHFIHRDLRKKSWTCLNFVINKYLFPPLKILHLTIDLLRSSCSWNQMLQSVMSTVRWKVDTCQGKRLRSLLTFSPKYQEREWEQGSGIERGSDFKLQQARSSLMNSRGLDLECDISSRCDVYLCKTQCHTSPSSTAALIQHLFILVYFNIHHCWLDEWRTLTQPPTLTERSAAQPSGLLPPRDKTSWHHQQTTSWRKQIKTTVIMLQYQDHSSF